MSTVSIEECEKCVSRHLVPAATALEGVLISRLCCIGISPIVIFDRVMEIRNLPDLQATNTSRFRDDNRFRQMCVLVKEEAGASQDQLLAIYLGYLLDASLDEEKANKIATAYAASGSGCSWGRLVKLFGFAALEEASACGVSTELSPEQMAEIFLRYLANPKLSDDQSADAAREKRKRGIRSQP